MIKNISDENQLVMHALVIVGEYFSIIVVGPRRGCPLLLLVLKQQEDDRVTISQEEQPGVNVVVIHVGIFQINDGFTFTNLYLHLLLLPFNFYEEKMYSVSLMISR